MYDQAKTWNPFKGCGFDCTYCVPSFQRQAKRQKHNCSLCYDYTPHEHPERLSKIPNSPIVFVCGNGDIAFAHPDYVSRTISAILRRNDRCPGQTYYLQSKAPECFARHLRDLPSNVILVTTLETNRDEGYGEISKAPRPSWRYEQFGALDWPRKVVTVEPVMAFDHVPFFNMLVNLSPEYIWIGFNSHPKSMQLPEPTEEDVRLMIDHRRSSGVEVRGRPLRGIDDE